MKLITLLLLCLFVFNNYALAQNINFDDLRRPGKPLVYTYILKHAGNEGRNAMSKFSELNDAQVNSSTIVNNRSRSKAVARQKTQPRKSSCSIFNWMNCTGDEIVRGAVEAGVGLRRGILAANGNASDDVVNSYENENKAALKIVGGKDDGAAVAVGLASGFVGTKGIQMLPKNGMSMTSITFNINWSQRIDTTPKFSITHAKEKTISSTTNGSTISLYVPQEIASSVYKFSYVISDRSVSGSFYIDGNCSKYNLLVSELWSTTISVISECQ